MLPIAHNPFDDPDCDPALATFLDRAVAEIVEQARGKKIIGLADAAHDAPGIIAFAFSKRFINALPLFNARHYMPEYFARADQVYIDAVAQGKLTPEQFVLSRASFRSGSMPVEAVRKTGLWVAEGINAAVSNQVRMHGVQAHEGVTKPDDQKKFTYWQMIHERAWLDFLSKNPKYFSDPEPLKQELLSRFKIKHHVSFSIDSSSIFSNSTAHESIRSLWEALNLSPKIPKGSNVLSKIERMTQDPAKEKALLAARDKSDPGVMNYIHELRSGEPAVVLYGASHFQHDRLMANISPSDSAVVMLLCHRDIHKFFDYVGFKPDMYDENMKVILLYQQEIVTWGDLFRPGRPQMDARKAPPIMHSLVSDVIEAGERTGRLFGQGRTFSLR